MLYEVLRKRLGECWRTEVKILRYGEYREYKTRNTLYRRVKLNLKIQNSVVVFISWLGSKGRGRINSRWPLPHSHWVDKLLNYCCTTCKREKKSIVVLLRITSRKSRATSYDTLIAGLCKLNTTRTTAANRSAVGTERVQVSTYWEYHECHLS